MAVRGVNAVVHLAAAKSDEKDSDDINIGGARRLVEVCRSADCHRIIHISTQSAKIARLGVYGRTKAEADRILRASGLAVTSLLPSVVYGEEPAGVFGTLRKFIEKLPVVPVLGDGRWISAPIYVGDVSNAILACLEQEATVGKQYDLGGPDQIPFDELIDRISAALRLHRLKLHIPFGLSLMAAKIVAALVPNPPITVSNVLGSNQNTDIDIRPACRDFGFAPLGLAAGLARVFPSTPHSELREEGRQIARYLLDVEPSPEILDRYVAGCRKLWASVSEEPETRWWRRHPHWLPLLDAAAGLVRPQSLVRKKVLFMAALLEATPEHAGFFLRPPLRMPWLLVRLAASGAWAVAKAVVGLPVLWWARRRG